jgi:hypothetical protein
MIGIKYKIARRLCHRNTTSITSEQTTASLPCCENKVTSVLDRREKVFGVSVTMGRQFGDINRKFLISFGEKRGRKE